MEYCTQRKSLALVGDFTIEISMRSSLLPLSMRVSLLVDHVFVIRNSFSKGIAHARCEWQWFYSRMHKRKRV